MLDCLIIYSAESLQYAANFSKHLMLFGRVKQVEVQIGRETGQIVEEHQCSPSLECQQAAQVLVTED